ncbi:glycosyltransferase family 2 protein [Bacillus sp. FJAT-42376]|uniref:glycosyltransferase family A protein n=1 Tax=Bacillus sp. FJAT-42376 TaxID=2014076 RepID=UPI000F505D9F|nr:glycosyltransferase family A protein [Bacillus sp. FJAT-42376]AZB42368.1 glycosyltransferase family 2 protein [Bacillus sp. FJAT-42376]
MYDTGVVMPVYIQKPSFLKAAIESMLNQDLLEFRMIIVVDGAPEMIELAERYSRKDARIEMLINETNQGVSKSLNRGFDLLFQDPSIKFVTWVSSDNIYYPNFLSKLRNTLSASDPQVGLVYSSFQHINDDGKTLLNEDQLQLQRNYQAMSKESLLDACIVGVSFMYRSEYAKKIDGYRAEPVEDYDYWLRLTYFCDMVFIPVELVDYRVDSELSISTSLKSENQHRRWRYMYHLVRHQARVRLQITPELTVVYIGTNTENAVKRAEDLYDQVFSNYHFKIVDRSPDQSITSTLIHIPHPLTEFISNPFADEHQALLTAIHSIQTPYTLILGDSFFPTPMFIQTLISHFRNADPSFLSSSFTSNYEQVVFQTDLNSEYPFTNQLFRTFKLKEKLQ